MYGCNTDPIVNNTGVSGTGHHIFNSTQDAIRENQTGLHSFLYVTLNDKNTFVDFKAEFESNNFLDFIRFRKRKVHRQRWLVSIILD